MTVFLMQQEAKWLNRTELRSEVIKVILYVNLQFYTYWFKKNRIKSTSRAKYKA